MRPEYSYSNYRNNTQTDLKDLMQPQVMREQNTSAYDYINARKDKKPFEETRNRDLHQMLYGKD